MAITFRGSKGSSLTHNELDQNFREFFHSASYEGSSILLHKFTAISSSVSIPLVNPVGRNGALQYKLGSAVSGANAQFTGSQNLTFVENVLKITGSILLDTQNEAGILEVTGSGKVTGNLTVGGTVTAQEFVTERNTIIKIESSGSTTFGDSADDIHERTGSLRILGNTKLNGNSETTGSNRIEGNTISAGIFRHTGKTKLHGDVTITGRTSQSGSIFANGGITGSDVRIFQHGSISGSLSALTASITNISSSIATTLDTTVITASAADNIITFTKGGGSAFTVTIDTGSTSGINSVVADTTPQLGGNLDLNTKSVSGSGAISIAGNIFGQNITGSNVLVTNVNATGLISGSVIKSANAISGSSLLIQGTIKATGDVTAFHSSDARLKDNITPIKGALDKIKTINGYEFDWNDKQNVHEGHDVGVIAQEIEHILPEIVVTRDNGFKAVRYEKIVALLINAIKEQQLQIDELKLKL
tara:strand:+ start:2229 stop:3653 length:1425 start_codon:yes stop_codon:yes gene_type:complete